MVGYNRKMLLFVASGSEEFDNRWDYFCSSWEECVKVTESSTFAIPGAVGNINVDNMPHKDRKGKICVLKKSKCGFVIS
jgi:hypothetical protein